MSEPHETTTWLTQTKFRHKNGGEGVWSNLCIP